MKTFCRQGTRLACLILLLASSVCLTADTKLAPARTKPAGTSPVRVKSDDRAASLRLREAVRGILRPNLHRVQAKKANSANVALPEAKVGALTVFKVDKAGGENKRPLAAVLKVVGEHCLIFLELGQDVALPRLQRIARTFDQHIYPRTVATFGSEWNPGVDGDPRITLLLLRGMQGSDGLFYPGDESTVDEDPGSNQREMLYLSIERLEDLDDFMGHLVAHELQHMIHWYHDDSETYWVEEGLSEYASSLFNHMPWTAAQFFLNPDRNLFDWEDARDYANYGHVFLFFDYLFNRPELSRESRVRLIHAVVENPEAGDRGLCQALAEAGCGLTFAGVFRDFSAALFIHDSAAGEHIYQFSPFVTRGLAEYEQNVVSPRLAFSAADGRAANRVSMWSTAGYEFRLQPDCQPLLRISFSGKTIPTCKGDNQFWLGLALTDSSGDQPPEVVWLPTQKNRLQRTVDLPGGYDRMLLLICNQGPLNYIDGDGPLPKAGFSFSVDEVSVP